MIKINGKEYRNIQEQVAKNQEDIAKNQEDIADLQDKQGYTKGEADAKFRTIDDSYSKSQSNSTFVSKANLTDYSINDIIVADSEIQSGSVELRAVSSQSVKSEVSLDPSSALIKTTSGTNNSTIGVSGTEVDVTTNTFRYNNSEVATTSYADNAATDAANAVKLYPHYIRIYFKLPAAPNVTYLATLYIISKDAEKYTLEDFKNITSLDVIKIPLPMYIGDALNTMIYDFAYALNNQYGVAYSQLSNGALTNMDTIIDESDITEFRDIVINL